MFKKRFHGWAICASMVALILFSLYACISSQPVPTDGDGDGFRVEDGDCDDSDAEVYPGADELEDGKDNDCNGYIDELDGDGDGFGEIDGDCDDDDPTIYPLADELEDGIDNDCDGIVDEGAEFIDYDGDGQTEAEGDCDDRDPSIYSGALDICGDGIDEDCDTIDPACTAPSGTINLSSILSIGSILYGEDTYNFAGASVSSAGDMDGDGYDDILISSIFNSDGGNTAGKVYLIYGPVAGEIDLSSSDASFTGEEAGDEAGTSISSAGNFNEDAYEDIVIGAPNNDENGENAGKVYLNYGPLYGSFDLSRADASFVGENMGDHAGISISSGDFNGDGRTDIVIGAEWNDEAGADAGKVYVIFGASLYGDMSLSSSDVTFIGEAEGDRAGRSVSNAGDVNADGFDDILIGAPENDDGGNYAGKVYLIYGSTQLYSFSLSSADASFIGEYSNNLAGWSVAGAGDVNGDGYGDILIGAQKNSSAGTFGGKTYLFFGPIAGDNSLSLADASFTGEDEYDLSGKEVSSAGDVNGDGYADILIGAPENDENGIFSGKAYLLYAPFAGTTSLSFADAIFESEGSYNYAGYALSSAGDVNGDGFSDFLIGAFGNDDYRGKVYLIYGGAG